MTQMIHKSIAKSTQFQQQFSAYTIKVQELITKMEYDLMQKYTLQSNHTKFPSLQSDVQIISQSIIFLFQEYQSFTKMLQLDVLIQPIKRILSFEHLLSNLILNLFQSASKFFHQKYMTYKTQKLRVLGRQATPSTQCVTVEEFTLQQARKQQFEDKQRLEAFINQNLEEQRNDFIDHLSQILNNMEFYISKAGSVTTCELEKVEEKMEEIVQFVNLVQFENRSNATERIQEIHNILDGATQHISNNLKSKFKQRINKFLQSLKSKLISKNKTLTTTQMQTQLIETSKFQDSMKIQKLKKELKHQQRLISTLQQRCQLFKSSIEKSKVQISHYQNQNHKLNLLVEKLALNVQEVEQKFKDSQIATFRTQKNLFDLYSKMEQQRALKLNARKSSIQVLQLDLIPLQMIEAGVQADEIIASQFQGISIQKKQFNLLNSNIQKQHKIKKLTDHNTSLVKNLNYLLEKIGGSQFAKQLLQNISTQGMTENIIENIINKYSDSQREIYKIKRKSLKQFLMGSMNIANHKTQSQMQNFTDELLKLETKYSQEDDILQINEEEEEFVQETNLVDMLKQIKNNSILQQNIISIQKPQKSIDKMQPFLSLNNSVHQIQEIASSKMKLITGTQKKVLLQKVEKPYSKLNMARTNKPQKLITQISVGNRSLNNSFVFNSKTNNGSTINTFSTVTIGNTLADASNKIIPNRNKKQPYPNTNLRNSKQKLIRKRNIATQISQINPNTDRTLKKQISVQLMKDNVFTPNLFKEHNNKASKSNQHSKKSSFEKHRASFYKEKTSKGKDITSVRRGQDSAANKILYKNYQIIKQKQLHLYKQELPKLVKIKNL